MASAVRQDPVITERAPLWSDVFFISTRFQIAESSVERPYPVSLGVNCFCQTASCQRSVLREGAPDFSSSLAILSSVLSVPLTLSCQPWVAVSRLSYGAAS